MSRVKTVLIAFILVVGILFPTTPILASPGATVSITDAALSPGASGSVVLSISATETVYSIDLDITYEPAVVEVTSVSGSDFYGLVSNIESGHTHLVAWVGSPTGLTGTIKVADITLTRLDGESKLALDVITLKGDANNPIAFTIDNGWVTGVAADNIPPTVITTSLATGVAITATVTATFSEVIDPDTLVFSVDGVSGTTTYTGTTATFTPSANLGYSRTYTASVSASDIAGNPMAAYSWTFTTRARPGGGGVYEPPTPPPGTTDVRGMVTTAGVFSEPVTATSEDELCTLDIPEGTVGLTEELEPLDEITVVEMDEPPDPPEDAHVVGLAYDLGPDGATFDPPITLTFSYDPDDLPEGVGEEDLVLAYYDEDTGEWVELVGVVDTVNNTITASVPHFTTFAIIGSVTEEEEVPTVVPPVGEEEEEEEVVILPEPAAFSVSYPAGEVCPLWWVEPGEPVTITVLVANTGGESGSYTVVLKIDGVKEAEETVTVAAGESQEVSFSVTREEANSYAVTVDGLSGSFTVVAPPEGEEEEEEVPTKPGINWPLIGGIIGGVIVAGLLIYFLVFRRRAY